MRTLYAILLFLVPAMLLLIVAQTALDPWHDEAMLVVNLLVPDLDLFAPMPYYEQAAPIGYVVIARFLLALTNEQPPYEVLRLLSAAFIAAGIVITLTARPLRSDKSAAVIFVALLLASPLIWGYAGEIKHYSAEFFASALVLRFGLALADDSRPQTLVAFVLAVLVGGLLSFTLPILVVGLLGAAAMTRLLALRRAEPKRLAPFVIFVAVGGIAVLYLAALYWFVNRGLVTYQIGAYAYVYGGVGEQGMLRLLISRTLGLLDVAVNIAGPTVLPTLREALANVLPIGLAYQVIRLLAVLVLALVVWLAARRQPFVALAFVTTCAVVAVLGLLGAVQMPYSRHILFLMPLSAMLMSIAGSAILERLLPKRSIAWVAAALLAVCLTVGALHGLGRETQETSKLLAHIEATRPDAPVWVFGGAQPAVSILTPEPARVLGLFDAASTPVAWQVRGGEVLDPAQNAGAWQQNPQYAKTIETLAGGEQALWMLFSNDGFAPDRTPYLEAAARAVGPCELAEAGIMSALYFCERQPAAQ